MYNANLEQSGIHPNVEHAKKGGEGVVIYIWKLKNGDIIPTVNTPRQWQRGHVVPIIC